MPKPEKVVAWILCPGIDDVNVFNSEVVLAARGV